MGKDCQTHDERLEYLFHVSLLDGAGDKPPVRAWVMSEAMGLQMMELWEEKYGKIQD